MSGRPRSRLDVRARVLRGQVYVGRAVADGAAPTFELDRTGLEIWRACDGTRSVTEIAAAVARRHGADEALVAADVRAFVDELVGLELMEWARDDAATPSASRGQGGVDP